MNIYTKNCYRTVLRESVEARKILDPDNNFECLANAVRIPKSYLSKVLHAKADLSSDQLHLACVHLQMNDDEFAYMDLLLEHARTGLAARRQRLEHRIAAIQNQHASAEDYLSAPVAAADQIQGHAEYFLDPWASIVHMALLIPRFRDDLALTSRQLGLTAARLNETILLLEKLRFIERKQKKIHVLVEQMHLPSSSLYRSWRAGLRSLGAAKVESMNETQSYSFSAVFTCDKKTEKEVRVRFLEMLKEIESAVGSATSTDVYQIEIGMFPWTSS
jgi:uncharacterized protein (TIGR02147 family)